MSSVGWYQSIFEVPSSNPWSENPGAGQPDQAEAVFG